MAFFGLFGKKKEKRRVWHWGEDRVITNKELEVESGVVMDNKDNLAFHSVQEFVMNDMIGGGLTLLVWQRDAFPKNPFRNLEDIRKAQLDDIDSIADEAGRIAKDKAIEDSRRNKLLNMFTTLGYIFGIIIAITFLVLVWQNGGIQNIFGGGS